MTDRKGAPEPPPTPRAQLSPKTRTLITLATAPIGAVFFLSLGNALGFNTPWGVLLALLAAGFAWHSVATSLATLVRGHAQRRQGR